MSSESGSEDSSASEKPRAGRAHFREAPEGRGFPVVPERNFTSRCPNKASGLPPQNRSKNFRALRVGCSSCLNA